jgi:hypothetical protein
VVPSADARRIASAINSAKPSRNARSAGESGDASLRWRVMTVASSSRSQVDAGRSAQRGPPGDPGGQEKGWAALLLSAGVFHRSTAAGMCPGRCRGRKVGRWAAWRRLLRQREQVGHHCTSADATGQIGLA